MRSLSAAILACILTLLTHMAEEITTGFRKKLPVGEMPLLLFVGINVLVYAFCFFTLFSSLNESALAVPLSWVLAVATIANGLGHIGMTLLRKRYFPGAVTAAGLLVAAGYLVAVLARQ